jgi:protein gp37
VFVGALGDLFHDDVPDETIAEVWAVMAVAHWHTFQILTKRHARMRSLLNDADFRDEVCAEVATLAHEGFDVVSGPNPWQTWPLPNVWVGVSAETQQWANIRIPALLNTPAALRWVSAEPLLGPVNLHTHDDGLHHWLPDFGPEYDNGTGEPVCQAHGLSNCRQGCAFVDWVVIGGESGAGARPLELTWVSDLGAQCNAAGVPVFVKQLGGTWARRHGLTGRGGNPDQWPPELRTRQFPADAATTAQVSR